MLTPWPSERNFSWAFFSRRVSSMAIWFAFSYSLGVPNEGPEMMSGVRASSMRMLSTSSMIA